MNHIKIEDFAEFLNKAEANTGQDLHMFIITVPVGGGRPEEISNMPEELSGSLMEWCLAHRNDGKNTVNLIYKITGEVVSRDLPEGTQH